MLEDVLRHFGAKKNGSGYRAKCPGHDDRVASLSINAGRDGRVVLKCQAGCSFEHVCEAAMIDPSEFFAEDSMSSAKCTVAALAEHKKIPLSNLREWGIVDRADGGVAIPYRKMDASLGARKYRTGVSAKEGNFWDKGATMLPYGLDRLGDARELEYVIIVEGESDCWALWTHGFPALGIPGASNSKVIERPHLAGLKMIYFVHEPDKGGETFAKDVPARLRKVGFTGHIIELQLDGAKDPAELQAKDPATFKATFAKILLAAARDAVAKDAPPILYANTIAPLAVEWLWRGRLAIGTIAVLDGDPGLGKSTITADLVARVTRGEPMPLEDVGRAPANALVISYEDSAAHVIVPRLMAAGADLARVAIWDVSRPLILPDGIAELQNAMAVLNPTIVIIDPVMAALSGEVNSNSDQDIRRLLADLSALAERSRAVMLIVRHLNKSGGGRAIYRGGGSIGIIGAARTGLLLDREEDHEDERLLATTKCNLGREGATLTARLIPAPAPAVGIEVARIEWSLAAVQQRADELLEDKDTKSDRYACNEAIVFLKTTLAVAPIPAAKVVAQAKQAGHSERTLRRAMATLKVRSDKVGAIWMWSLGSDA